MASKNPVPRSADNGSKDSESFDETARRMLESALELHGAQQPLATREIHECARSLAAHAKGRGLEAERLLIELKQTWYGIAESGAHQKSEVISQLVTLCIREYYGAAPEPVKG